MLIPVGFAQINMRFTGIDTPRTAEMTFGVDHQAFVGTTAEIGDAVGVAWAASLDAEQSNDVVLSSILVKKGPNATGASAEVFPNTAGALTVSTAPPQVAILIKKVTGLGGREGRGRMYMPGYSETNINGDGSLGSTPLADLQTQADAFYTALQTGDLQMVLLHNSATVPTDVLSLQVDSRVATQRRRLRG